jgi:hypothetical protein
MSKLLGSDLYRALVLTLLAAVATVTVAFANRDVYSKAQVDSKFDACRELEDERHERLDKEIEYMHDDIRWIVRRMGGTPSAKTEEDHNSP